MNAKFLLATSLVLCMSLSLPAISQDHHTAVYVPWGVDEYELFGLTGDELSKKFAKTLRFEENHRHAYFCTGRSSDGPQFILHFNNGRVSRVQRMFIDGGGCHIIGPELQTKKEALKFSTEGLSDLGTSASKEDTERLQQASKMLKDLESA